MTAGHLREAYRTVVPAAAAPYGPVPPMLLALTVVSGLVDAFSYLQFYRVFLANITGNVIFLGFAVGGARGFVWWTSSLAIIAFILGAYGAGRLRFAQGTHFARQILIASCIEIGLIGVATAIAAGWPGHSDPMIAVLIVPIGAAMGLQNATARSIAIPGLNTTVLTLSLSDMAAESTRAGGRGSHAGRRTVALLAMALGAAIGAVLVTRTRPVYCLVACLVVLIVVAVAAARRRSTTERWATR